MGWTFTHRPKGQTTVEFFKEQFECDNEVGKWEILACATKGMTVYLAIRLTTKATGETETFAVVCPISWRRKEYNNFGYKDVCESMGPVRAQCPARILDLLDPTDKEYANEWRERCRQNLAKAKSKPPLKKCDVVEFKRPLRFGDETLTTLVVADAARRVAINPNSDRYQFYRLPLARLNDPEGYTVTRGGQQIHPK